MFFAVYPRLTPVGYILTPLRGCYIGERVPHRFAAAKPPRGCHAAIGSWQVALGVAVARQEAQCQRLIANCFFALSVHGANYRFRAIHVVEAVVGADDYYVLDRWNRGRGADGFGFFAGFSAAGLAQWFLRRSAPGNGTIKS